MDFHLIILFHTQDGKLVERLVAGQFYPTDLPRTTIEDVLWEMTETYGRPVHVNMQMQFWGEQDGTVTPKRIEVQKTTA